MLYFPFLFSYTGSRACLSPSIVALTASRTPKIIGMPSCPSVALFALFAFPGVASRGGSDVDGM